MNLLDKLNTIAFRIRHPSTIPYAITRYFSEELSLKLRRGTFYGKSAR
jgi:hypothetical protein